MQQTPQVIAEHALHVHTSHLDGHKGSTQMRVTLHDEDDVALQGTALAHLQARHWCELRRQSRSLITIQC